MSCDPERWQKACYTAIAVNLFIGQNKQASLSAFISTLFHNIGAEMRAFLSALRAGRAEHWDMVACLSSNHSDLQQSIDLASLSNQYKRRDMGKQH